MKALCILLSMALLPLISVGQSAPDFTMTDIDGQSWNLHGQLAQGKTVVLDFFFVDCVPCQNQSPEVASMYSDYGGANGDVLVLGISNRDENAEIEQFDVTYGVNFPTAGTQGGGDTVTELYQSYFPFFGWPTFAVVCPDTSIEWNITLTLPGVPELRQAVDECQGSSAVDELDISEYVELTDNELRVLSDEVRSIRITDMLGRELFFLDGQIPSASFPLACRGLLLITLELSDRRTIQLKTIRP